MSKYFLSKRVGILLTAILLVGALFPASTLAGETDSNPDISTVVEYVHFEDGNNILSPNRDGLFEEVFLNIGLKKKVSLNAEVWDAMNPGGGPYNDGTIGFIFKLGYQGPGEYKFRTNGTYNMWQYPDPNLKFTMHDSVYSLHIHADSYHEDGNFKYEGYVPSGPLLVKSEPSVIHFNPVTGNKVTGTIEDNFVNYKSVVENVFGENYDVNDYLNVNYELRNASNSIVDRGSISLGQDGSFNISLTGHNPGTYTVIMKVRDAAGNPEQTEPLRFELKENSDPVDRINGATRYDTAIEISKEGWNSANTVILSRGDNFADALAGVPLAHKIKAPILMTPATYLFENTLKEIKRLGAKEVVILGGTGAVNKKVENDLKAAGLNVRRISGPTRYETAALIASEVAPNGTSRVVVANGLNFPDALSVASHAASEGLPIILTSSNTLPEATSNAIRKLGAKNTVVIGGTSVVSENVKRQLPNATRLSGKDRYETNVAVHEHFGVEENSMYVATGQNYADALTGAVLAAKNNTSILLVHQIVPDKVAKYIINKKLTSLSIFGGSVAVSEKVMKDLEKLIK